MTKILLVVSIVFLLSNTPSHVVRLYLFIMSQLHANYKPGYPILITQNVLQYLFYANFATNFLLYNASGRTFRRAMRRCGRHCFGRLTGGCRRNVNRRCSFADQAARMSPAVGGPDTARNRATPATNPIPLIRLTHAPQQNDIVRRF